MYELNSFRVTLKQEALFNISNNQILYYRLFLKTSKQNKIKWVLIESSLNSVPYVLCVPAWSTCPRGNVPINVPTCKRRPIIQLGVPRRISYSTWRPKLPKLCQFFNLACQRAKRGANFLTSPVKMRTNFSSIFQKNFSIMLNICKFLEYLGNCRKFISRNKEFKFWHLQKFY